MADVGRSTSAHDMNKAEIYRAKENLRRLEAEAAGRLNRLRQSQAVARTNSLREERAEIARKKLEQKKLKQRGALEQMAALLRRTGKYPKCPCAYLISQEGYCKIGYTTDMLSRRQQIIVGTPFEIHVLATILCESAKAAENMEAALHSEFSSKRHRGEWFKLEDSDIEQIINNHKERTVDYRSTKGADEL